MALLNIKSLSSCVKLHWFLPHLSFESVWFSLLQLYPLNVESDSITCTDMLLKYWKIASLILVRSTPWNALCGISLKEHSYNSRWLGLSCEFESFGSVLPAPQMNTVLPSVTPALRQAWIPTDRGSISAPSSNVTLSGNLEKRTAWEYRRRKTEKDVCRGWARESAGSQRSGGC